MHRYRLEFVAKPINETRLRNLLERAYGASSIAISRHPDVVPSALGGMDGFEGVVLGALADGRPRRRKQLMALAKSPAKPLDIYRATLSLVKRGLVQKVRNGVYILAGSPLPTDAEIPPMDAAFDRPTQNRILELLTSPMTAVQLREQIGVSRQRIEQILSRLAHRGIVERSATAGERGQFVYSISGQKRSALVTRSPVLTEAVARTLSALPPETMCLVGDVAGILKTPASVVTKRYRVMAGQGLVATVKLGGTWFAAATPRGVQHPQYDRGAPKAPAANLIEEFGSRRVAFLQRLFVLGPVRTIAITDSLPRDFFDEVGYSSGQVIQRLAVSGLIEADGREGRQKRYRLTSKGLFTVEILNRLQPPPDRATVVQLASAQRAERARRLSALGRRGAPAALSPQQASIMEALADGAALATREVLDRMVVKFGNEKSFYQAVMALAKRGFVTPVREDKKLLWQRSVSGSFGSKLTAPQP